MKTVYFCRKSNGVSHIVHCLYDPPFILFHKKPEGLNTDQILEEVRVMSDYRIPEVKGVTFSNIKITEYIPTKVKSAYSGTTKKEGIEEIVTQ